ncbi:MAG: oxidoreductase [Candidatus Electryonea clarkiae]|nr:oxidoreductase [Candidatus Electryonea clarkiae]MDP8288335.1 oxidoreductase [Candidatus Electryonea clarkiae]
MAGKNWTQKDIPDQSGRIAIVTGSNTGLGFHTVRFLVEKNAKVVMACRSQEKAKTARDNILGDFPDAGIDLITLDLSRQASVREFAAAYREKYDKLDLLINNAGVMMCPFDRTEDGFELQLGTNHFGHFALTGLLMPTLLATENSRIVTLSSMAARSGRIDFDDLNFEKRLYKEMEAYGQTKLANLLFARELQRRFEEAGHKTLSLAAHPGWTATDLQRHVGVFKYLNYIVAMPAPKGSLPTMRAATEPGVKGGDYFGPDGWMEMRGYPVVVDPTVGRNAEAVNFPDAKRLWEVSEELTGVKYEI